MSDNLVKISPETNEAIKEALKVAQDCTAITIKTAEDYQSAADLLKEVKSRAARLTEARQTITRPIDAAKKAAMALFAKPLDALLLVEGKIKRAIADYQYEAERKRLTAEAAIRTKQEAERKRLEAQAERLREQGKAAKADEKLAKAEELSAPVVLESSVPKVVGVSSRTVWKYRIVDEAAIPRSYLTPDVKKIGQVVKATAGTLAIPGVEIYPEASIAAGRATVADDGDEEELTSGTN